MAFPYSELFLGLLLAYMVYSAWTRLDARYPIAAALVLLVVTAVVDALGATDSANTLAEYVFFLLGGGVVLLLVEHVRESRGPPAPAATSSAELAHPPARDAPREAEPGSDESLRRLPSPVVPRVDATRPEAGKDERDREADPDLGLGERATERARELPEDEGDLQGRDRAESERAVQNPTPPVARDEAGNGPRDRVR